MQESYIKFKLTLILIFSILFYKQVNAQVTKVRGIIKDSATEEPIPFVSVAFMDSNIGTITDFNGEFFLETKQATDSIIFSSMGYKRIVKPVRKNIFQEVSIILEPDNYEIEEVVITPGENPAHPILKNIIANKYKHHPNNIDAYHCEIYNKVQIDINNVDDEFRKRKIFNQFQFIFDNVDTSSLTGKPYLPILLTETLSDYYYSEKPSLEHEVINASRISGTNNESLSEFTGRMYQKLELYDNFITIFEPGFVSPIADFGLMYYKYFLIDSLFVNDHWCYKISFKPKRKQERTFTGYFIVTDTSFAIVETQLRIAEDANINFINDYMATLQYDQVDDSVWFLTEEKHIVDFNLTDKALGFFGRKTTSYKNIRLDNNFPNSVINSKTTTSLGIKANEKDNEYWELHRHDRLTEKEENIYEMVDSIRNVPLFRTAEDIIQLLTNYYYVIGPFEYGPYYKTFSSNYVEGSRVRIGGRTSNAFSTKIMFNGHVAYGFKDEKFKYGVGALYMFSKNPRVSAGFQYLYDRKQLGQSDNAFSEDNFMTTLLRRSPNKTLTMVEEYRGFFEKEWYQGLSNTLSFKHSTIYPVEAIPFQFIENDADPIPVPSITSSEITLSTRFAKDEKFLYGEFERISLGTTLPIVEFGVTAGFKNLLGGDYDYLKLNLNISDKVELNPIGYLRYSLDAGKIYGKLPFPLLELHQGNETYAHDYLSFNMMNYYEFVSDEYVSLWTEHHFQGFFLNRIPLLRKLEWREVASAKGVIGNLNDRHRQELTFPEGLTNLTKPYYEAGVGIENIFKFFRVDAYWRLAYLDHDDIQKFGLRVKLQVIL